MSEDWSDLDTPQVCRICGSEYVGHEHKAYLCLPALEAKGFRKGLEEAAKIARKLKRVPFSDYATGHRDACNQIESAIEAKWQKDLDEARAKEGRS